MEWLDKGAFDLEGRLRSVNKMNFPPNEIFLATNRFHQHLPQLCLEGP